MSFLLCHECFNWVEPKDGRCPECIESIEAAVPDPSEFELRTTIGDIVFRLGEVHVRRRMLPDRGMLYVTTNGLYFLPHDQEDVLHLVESPTTEASLMWSLAAMVWSPLMLVLPFVRSKETKTQRIQVPCPKYLTTEDSDLLPQLLMTNPGVFFLSRKSIREMSLKRRRWRIERFQGSPVRVKPEDNAKFFHHLMGKLALSDSWEQAICTTQAN